MQFLKDNAVVIVVVLVALVLLYMYMYSKPAEPEQYQDDIGIDGRGLPGRGLKVNHYITGCTKE